MMYETQQSSELCVRLTPIQFNRASYANQVIILTHFVFATYATRATTEANIPAEFWQGLELLNRKVATQKNQLLRFVNCIRGDGSLMAKRKKKLFEFVV